MQRKSNYIYATQILKCKKHENNLFAYGLDIYKTLHALINLKDEMSVRDEDIKHITKISGTIISNNDIRANFKLIWRPKANIINPITVSSRDLNLIDELDNTLLEVFNDRDIDVVDGESVKMYVKLHANIGVQDDSLEADYT